MRHALIAISALALAGCEAAPGPAGNASSDAEAVAMVKKAQDSKPPLRAVSSGRILVADLDKHDLYGAGCTFAPEGAGAADFVFLGDDVRGAVKIDGAIVILAADSGSPALPYGARERYTGKEFSIQLAKGAGEGIAASEESAGWPCTLTIRDQWERPIYTANGSLECGA